MATSEVLLKDKNVLNDIKKLFQPMRDKSVIEIGTGQGDLAKQIPTKNLLSIEINPKFIGVLAYTNINYKIGKFQALKLNNQYEVLVSNLPFNQIIDILKHAYDHYDNIKQYYIILPKEIYEKTTSNLALGRKFRLLFDNFEILKKIKGNSYKPQIRFDTYLIKMKRKQNPNLTENQISSYFKWLKVVRPNKKLINNLNLKVRSLDFEKTLQERFINVSDEQLLKIFLKFSIKI